MNDIRLTILYEHKREIRSLLEVYLLRRLMMKLDD